ncbi:hypothetical protein GCM10023089_08990 [Quisquiliibacterium transsilvanicum]|uniref:Uncharacterized protein n=1 Tax=Quisquiliibacterium transsilvanicum TaxID=1549638 RepID=A0A7W8HHK6_9BURK|nr:hypothetical protein [Quisquiliibacterium transsilvanicum]
MLHRLAFGVDGHRGRGGNAFVERRERRPQDEAPDGQRKHAESHPHYAACVGVSLQEPLRIRERLSGFRGLKLRRSSGSVHLVHESTQSCSMSFCGFKRPDGVRAAAPYHRIPASTSSRGPLATTLP